MNTSNAAGSILVGVDGSEASARAVLWAEKQSRLEGRPLVLVHAIDPRRNKWAGEYGFGMTQFVEAIEAGGRELLETARAAVRLDANDKLDVQTIFELADPRQVLMDLSDEASMIVVGSRGYGPVRSLLLGSVSIALTQHARCPVVVMRPQEADDSQRQIVVGLSGFQPLSSAAEFAFRQASLRSLPLTILHGFWDPTLGHTDTAPHAMQALAYADEAQQVLKTVAGMTEKFRDVVVTYRIAKGLPDDSLLAASKDAGMVVVGARHKSTLSARLEGQVSRTVTEHAHCVVAVVPEL
ncbi:MAG: universal stress protein [Nocardioidaceae bacterium]